MPDIHINTYPNRFHEQNVLNMYREINFFIIKINEFFVELLA